MFRTIRRIYLFNEYNKQIAELEKRIFGKKIISNVSATFLTLASEYSNTYLESSELERGLLFSIARRIDDFTDSPEFELSLSGDEKYEDTIIKTAEYLTTGDNFPELQKEYELYGKLSHIFNQNSLERAWKSQAESLVFREFVQTDRFEEIKQHYKNPAKIQKTIDRSTQIHVSIFESVVGPLSQYEKDALKNIFDLQFILCEESRGLEKDLETKQINYIALNGIDKMRDYNKNELQNSFNSIETKKMLTENIGKLARNYHCALEHLPVKKRKFFEELYNSSVLKKVKTFNKNLKRIKVPYILNRSTLQYN